MEMHGGGAVYRVFGAALAAARDGAGGANFERGTSRSPEPPGPRPYEAGGS